MIQYILLQEWPPNRFHDIVVSKPKTNGDTADGVIESSITLSLHTGNIDSFIHACDTKQAIRQLVQDPASVIKEFRDWEGLQATTEGYKGYDLTKDASFSGFSGALPMKKESGLGKARDYADQLRSAAAQH